MGRYLQTEVDMANAALRLMEAPPISSFDDGSPSARAMRPYYDVVLCRCLGLFDWNFCAKQAELAVLPRSPLPQPGGPGGHLGALPQYAHAYRIPPDFVKLRWVRPRPYGDRGFADANNYEIVSGNILVTDMAPPVFMGYTYEAPVEYFPHYFIELLVSSLVEECAPLFGYNLIGQQRYGQRVYGPSGKLEEAIRQERAQGNHGVKPLFGGVLGAVRNW
jgi:hypothetical protein